MCISACILRDLIAIPVKTDQHTDNVSAGSVIELKAFVAISFRDRSGVDQKPHEINGDSIPLSLCGVQECNFDPETGKWRLRIGSAVDGFCYQNGKRVDSLAVNINHDFRTFFYGTGANSAVARMFANLPSGEITIFSPSLTVDVGQIFKKNLGHEELEAFRPRFANIARLKAGLLDDVIEAVFMAGGRRLGINYITTDTVPLLKGPQRFLFIASNAHLLDSVLCESGILSGIDVLAHPLRVPLTNSLVDVCLIKNSVTPEFVVAEHPKISLVC